MLVLTRKCGQSIIINDEIKIMVVQVKGKQVRIGIQAPMSSKIFREEIYPGAEKKSALSDKPKEKEIPFSPMLAKAEDE
ncbi:MAG: carbon storage regulator [Deltaproteobacteria bacterium RIFCSPHIGHO2_12_FULL_43_9]|nr:MAG: carbon storage regulator [Deltaproteobacteria bacterium RIFCSPHIGHO2_12_FULL_43_9]